MKNCYEVKIIKIVGENPPWSVRCWDGSVEYIIGSVDSYENAQMLLNEVKDADPFLEIVKTYLLAIRDVATRIKKSNGNPGTDSYATKKHMTQWAAEIMDYTKDLVGIINKSSQP